MSAAARLGVAAFTKTALDGGRMMGLTTAEMPTVIASLSRRPFYAAPLPAVVTLFRLLDKHPELLKDLV